MFHFMELLRKATTSLCPPSLQTGRRHSNAILFTDTATFLFQREVQALASEASSRNYRVPLAPSVRLINLLLHSAVHA